MARIWWAIACCAYLGVTVAVALPAAATSAQEQVIGKDAFAADGITVVKTAPEVSHEGSPRAVEDDKEDLETMVIDRVERYLKTHSLKMDISGNDVLSAVSNAGRSLSDAFGLAEEDSATEEGRGKKKKAQKMLLPLLLMLKLKAAAILPLVLGAIALIAGKALLVGKIALLLAGIIGLKKLLHTQKSVTYEIVSHPHHAHHESHGHESYSGIGGGDGGGYASSGGGGGGGGGGHGGWARSQQDAQQLAYNSYQPVKQ